MVLYLLFFFCLEKTIMELPGMPRIPTLGDMAKVAPPAIAAGTFSSGAKDEVAAADIYKLTSAVAGGKVKPITSIQELSAAIDKSVFDLTLDAGIASDFMSKVNGQLVFDKDILTNRLLGVSGEFKSCFNELNDALKRGAMASTFKDKADQLMCKVGDVSTMVSSAKINDVRALGNFVNKYTGTKVFSGQDKGAISGLLGSVITTSSDLGISGAFKSIAETVNDNGILGRVTRAVLPIAMRNSDTKMLREIASSPAASLVNVFAPGFTQNFSRAFTYRGDRSKSLDSFEDVFHAFENVNGAWDTLERGEEGNSALNLLSIIGGSRDFQNLVMTGVRYWTTEQSNGRTPPMRIDPLYALASVYPEVTVGRALQRDFPKVALLSVYNARLPRRTGLSAGTRNSRNNNIVDARLINGALGALFGY